MLRRVGRQATTAAMQADFQVDFRSKNKESKTVQKTLNDDDQTHRRLSRVLASVYCDTRLLGHLIARAGQHGERERGWTLKTYSTLRRALASV
jgi:hypothetical protein